MDRRGAVSEPISTTVTPFVGIIDFAEERDVNAFIVGSGDKGPSEQYRMGITAERLGRRAERPVLVVKHGTVS